MKIKGFLQTVIFVFISVTAYAQDEKYEVVKVAEGVYTMFQTAYMPIEVHGNSTIIINDEDVVVIDSRNQQAAARELIAEIRKLTKKPVRYVINTHWHGDHLWGNYAFREAYPQVEFIAHDNTREDAEKQGIPGLEAYIKKDGPESIKNVKELLAKGERPNGTKFTAEEIDYFTRQVESTTRMLKDYAGVRYLLPTLTIDKDLTLNRGSREIKIMYLGRGNTRGDLVVYLPKEKILISGDLIVNPIPYAFGSFIGDWIQTLKRLSALDFETFIPGHGKVQKDRQYLDLVTQLLESTLEQTRDAVKKGLSLEDTRKAVNRDTFRIRFTNNQQMRNAEFRSFFLTPAVERAYKELKGEL